MGTSFIDIRNALMKTDPEKTFKTELLGRIKGIREREDISQSELSRRSGVPQKTISRMESGLSTPSIETLYKLIDSLGYKLDYKIVKK